MNLFDQYGIKEVADVTIYSIHKKEDGSGDVYYVPALYLDTLKVTTTEKTADNTWAQGGRGNSRLVAWDYNKQINFTLEDALCTPASLGLCWGGILSSDWKDGQVNHQYGIKDATSCGGTERISRMEKAFYPRNDATNAVISNLLPRDGSEQLLKDWNDDQVYLERSAVLDGTDVHGFGYLDGHPYKWRVEIDSAIKSIAVVPDRFFSIYGKVYPIKRKQTVGINQPSESFKYEIIYLRGYDKYDDEGAQAKIIYHKQAEENITHEYTCESDREALAMLDDFTTYPYLKIRVCFDGSIKAYLGEENVDWDLTRPLEDEHANEDTAWIEVPQINTEQFRGIDLWLRFESINALSYYLITKYEENIFAIGPKDIVGGLDVIRPADDDDENAEPSNDNEEETNTHEVKEVVGLDYTLQDSTGVDPSDECVPCCKKTNLSRSIWAYVNPKTMTPYDDDYWFHQGEPYYKKSLTISTKEAPIKAKKIIITAGDFPGMYKIIGETFIRNRDTGEDQRMQFVFPLCKIKSNQTLTLQADGDPTTFNLEVEAAVPQSGNAMEITFYDVEKDLKRGCCGALIEKDGSTRIASK